MGKHIPRRIIEAEQKAEREQSMHADESWRGLRLLVCGCREFRNGDYVFWLLDNVRRVRGIREIIEGGAPGAEALAGEWADARGVLHMRLTAGDRGEAKRNAALISLKPDGLICMPGKPSELYAQALRAGLMVWQPERLPSNHCR